MTDIATVSHDIKMRLYDATRELFGGDEINVSFGHPGHQRNIPDLIAWTDIRTEQDPATLGTNRSRNEDVYVGVMISCFRAGVQGDDLAPSTAAYAILRKIEHYARQTDTTLGGLALWCFLDNTRSGGVTDPSLLAKGRLIQIEAEFKARVRITGS